MLGLRLESSTAIEASESEIGRWERCHGDSTGPGKVYFGEDAIAREAREASARSFRAPSAGDDGGEPSLG